MSAPPHTARQTPTGIYLEEGHQAFVALENDPNINIWEIEVGIPGIDGGEPIDTSTQHNDTWRTFAPRSLKTLMPFTCRCAYDPVFYTEFLAQTNNKQGVTDHFPDTSMLSFWGFPQKIEPDGLSEGGFPTANVTFVPTNQDPTTGAEEPPVFYNASTL